MRTAVVPGLARVGALVAALFTAAFAAACGTPQAPAPWTVSETQDITGPSDDLPATLRADIFIDSTESMLGFAAVPFGQYGRLLDDVEATLINAGRPSDIRYFKFGTTVRNVDRSEFRNAKSAAFYKEGGLSERTAIDAVLNKAEATRLTIVITDLFQDDGDVNAILKAVQAFLARKSAVGILGVPSGFDGTVYDSRVPPYKYKSTDNPATRRPFYALLFGNEAEIVRLINAIPQGHIDRSLFTLITRFPVSQYSARVERKANLNALEGDAPDVPVHRLAMQNRSKPAEATATITVTRRLGVPPIDFKRVGLSVQRLAPGAEAVDHAGLRMVEANASGDALALSLSLEPGTAKGLHQYRVDVRLPEIDAYALPAWVMTWTSDSPSPERDPNRTLNLASFVRSLLQTSTSMKPPLAIGRFHVNLQQK